MKFRLALILGGVAVCGTSWAQTPQPLPPSQAPAAPQSPGLPPNNGDTPSLQQTPPTGTLRNGRVPKSGVIPAPKTGDEGMDKQAPRVDPNMPTTPEAKPGMPAAPNPAPPP